MAISLASLQRSTRIEPPKVVIYGVNGIGKTTFGAMSPNPVFLLTEKGLGKLDVTHFPVAKTWEDAKQSIMSLLTEEHTFQTFVVDSVDWLERLIFEHVAHEAGKKNIEDMGYGKGYAIAQNLWYEFTDMLDRLNEEKKMAIILVGHALVKTFNSPDTENYDRYRLDMHDKSASVIKDWCDVILFANYKVYIKSSDEGFNKKEHKGVGGDERVMYSEERPAFWAKNRYGLPFEMPLSWQSFATAMSSACSVPKQEVKSETLEQGAQ